MYNAEVPRLNAEVKGYKDRLAALESVVASMSAPASATTPTAFLTDKDKEEYGESINVMRRVFAEERQADKSEIASLRAMLTNLQTSVVPQIQHVAHMQTQSNEQKFWGRLTDLVPNWQEINEKQEFQTWLLDIDPMSSVSRQTMLDDAQNNLSADRVAAFFQTWMALSGSAPSPTVPNNARSELDKQIAPGKSRAGAPSATSPKTYTKADIAKFYRDVSHGVFKGRDAERAETERDIFAAQREGRIVNAA
jgi:hypothetical protein